MSVLQETAFLWLLMFLLHFFIWCAG